MTSWSLCSCLPAPRYLLIMICPFVHHYGCYIVSGSLSLSLCSALLCSPAQLVLTNSKERHLHILTFANQCVLAHTCVVLTMMYSVIKVPGVLLITVHRHSGLCRRSQDNRLRLFQLRHDSIAYSRDVLMRNTFSNVCRAGCLVAEILNKRVTTQPKWLFYQGEVCL